MTVFAGIVRQDGRAIPKDWADILARAVGTLPSSRLFGASDSGIFVASNDCLDRQREQGLALILSDARLDNPQALAAQLELTGAADDYDDASIIVRSYRRWGSACVEELVGEFALAAWEPTGNRLYLSCDRLGIRPIYYVAGKDAFAFSSALRVLLALPFVSRALRDETICDLLCNDGSGPAEATFYEGICRLPAGHWLTLDGGKLATGHYGTRWTATVSATAKTDAEYAQDLRNRIVTAVECRLRGGNTIAVHLSGGLDSSAIACIAARRLKQEGRRLLALCSVLPKSHTGPEQDERPFIEAVLAQEDNIDAVWVEGAVDTNPFGALPRSFACLGEPPFSNVTHIDERLGNAGKACGVDVVLSGFGGDFFASAPGANAIAAMLRQGRWLRAFAELRAMRRVLGNDWIRLLKREIISPLVLNRLRALVQRENQTCAHPELIQRVAVRRGWRSKASRTTMASASPHDIMRFILAPGHVEKVLSSVHQLYAHEFGQDIRFPLLDTRIIEAVLGTPIEQFQKDGWPRSLMRRAMVGILPEMIRLRRDKGGAFDPAIASRCVASRPELAQWAADTANRRCWTYVDESRFLNALSAIEPANRESWRAEMFSTVILGGRIANFIDWHQRSEERGWA